MQAILLLIIIQLKIYDHIIIFECKQFWLLIQLEEINALICFTKL